MLFHGSGPQPTRLLRPKHRPFTMAAGDFEKLYGGGNQRECWDAIVTCFFIDTAPVIIE